MSNGFSFALEKILPSEASANNAYLQQANRVPRRHAASDTTPVRPELLMVGRRRSAVGVVVVAPGTSSFVGRMFGNRGVGGRRN